MYSLIVLLFLFLIQKVIYSILQKLSLQNRLDELFENKKCLIFWKICFKTLSWVQLPFLSQESGQWLFSIVKFLYFFSYKSEFDVNDNIFSLSLVYLCTSCVGVLQFNLFSIIKYWSVLISSLLTYLYIAQKLRYYKTKQKNPPTSLLD